MTYLINTTFGALLLGGYCSAVLSGIVTVQTILYIRLFPHDSASIKAIVAAVWTLDTIHSVLVYVAVWNYLITDYGNEKSIETISIPLASTIMTTAILMFIVHCFFAHRIHRLSRQRWSFTVLILVLTLLRLCCASATTGEMIRLKTFAAALHSNLRIIFTLGLVVASAVDILITVFLTHTLKALQKEQKESTSLDRVIDALVMYTFETNLLITLVTILALIFWLAMRDTLIFMGIHFSISKLYANSLLATLNTRKQFRNQRRQDASIDLHPTFPRRLPSFRSRSEPVPTQLRINVEKTVEFGCDDSSPSPSSKRSNFEPRAI